MSQPDIATRDQDLKMVSKLSVSANSPVATHPCPIPDQADAVLGVANCNIANRILLIPAQEAIQPTLDCNVRKPASAPIFCNYKRSAGCHIM